MRLIALLAFYDEDETMLRECVTSLETCCDHLVALDGAYALFPKAKAHSGKKQTAAIVSTAKHLGMGVTYSAPAEPWQGNEVEKRNALFELGKAIAGQDDWFLIVDADMAVTSVPSNLAWTLERTDCCVGTYWLADPVWNGRHPIRLLFRNAPDLRVTTTHYGYRRGDVYLWETGGMAAVESDLVV